ncbi:hypothetical protein VTP01DRAFT_7620 [Rhizomucor pusillus]|uniref:uncharacterized protein n=1 Tax=Rhizomucor pusillus TaxID=4840 RepID=UPI0037420759
MVQVMGLTCNLLYSVLSVSLFYAAFTRANTDKLIFRGDVRHAFACSERINQWATPETTLQPPHKCVQMRQLSRDKQEHWYAIQALQDKMAYEIRISYPATFPTDFELSWIDACKVLPPVLNTSETIHQDTDKVNGLVSVKGLYTGITHKDAVSPVTYDIVLENLYSGFLFYHVYKVVLSIASVLCIGYLFIIPAAKHIAYSIDQPKILKTK